MHDRNGRPSFHNTPARNVSYARYLTNWLGSIVAEPSGLLKNQLVCRHPFHRLQRCLPDYLAVPEATGPGRTPGIESAGLRMLFVLPWHARWRSRAGPRYSTTSRVACRILLGLVRGLVLSGLDYGRQPNLFII